MKRQIEVGDRVKYFENPADFEAAPVTGLVAKVLGPPCLRVGIVPDAYVPGDFGNGPSFIIRLDSNITVVETLAERERMLAQEYAALWERFGVGCEPLSPEEQERYKKIGRQFYIRGRWGHSRIIGLAAEEEAR